MMAGAVSILSVIKSDIDERRIEIKENIRNGLPVCKGTERETDRHLGLPEVNDRESIICLKMVQN